MQLLYYFLVAFAIGSIGTCAGGLLAIFFRNPSKKITSSILSFTSGLMLAIICFDLLPEAHEVGGFFVEILGMIFGLLTIFLFEEIIPLKKLQISKNKNQDYLKMSFIILISLGIHNFPEGVALGSSFVYSENIGFKLGILIALHNVPEGMTAGIPLIMAGFSPLSVLILTLLTGLPTAFGAIVGAVLGTVSRYFICFCLSSAASCMLYVTASQLLPEASNLYKGRVTSVFLLIGFITGCYLSFAI